MLLDGRTAVVYGASGFVGSAVACAFADAGASVVLVGRTQAGLDEVAERIHGLGGEGEVAVLDVTDEEAVDAHAATVVQRAGGIDVSFNATTFGDSRARRCSISGGSTSPRR